MHNISGGNGYTAGYTATPSGGIGPGYDTKMTGSLGGPIGSGGSFRGGSVEGPTRSIAGTGSVNNVPLGSGGPGSIGGDNNTNAGVASPLMGSGAAGVGAGGGLPPQGSPGGATTPPDTSAVSDTYLYRAKALYSCKFLFGSSAVTEFVLNTGIFIRQRIAR